MNTTGLLILFGACIVCTGAGWILGRRYGIRTLRLQAGGMELYSLVQYVVKQPKTELRDYVLLAVESMVPALAAAARVEATSMLDIRQRRKYRVTIFVAMPKQEKRKPEPDAVQTAPTILKLEGHA